MAEPLLVVTTGIVSLTDQQEHPLPSLLVQMQPSISEITAAATAVAGADVALITSLRDGMNLVSYEYVACQADNAGVLVLSEFAGAAQSLGAGENTSMEWGN